MLPELSSLYESLRRRKADMLNALEEQTSEQRRKQPTALHWSPVQILDHVVLVEEWMAGPDARQPPSGSKVSIQARLFVATGGRFMRSGQRVPTLSASEPGQNETLDYAAIRERWEQSRRLLLPKLEAVTPANRSFPISLHPVVGPLDAKRVLELLDAHLYYHLRHLPR